MRYVIGVSVDPYLAGLAAGFAVALLAAAAIALALPSLAVHLPLRDLTRRPAPVGGIAVLGAFALAPFIAAAISDRASEYFVPKRGDFLGFLAAVTLVFVTGLIDD